tara:strand:- start:3640 stop:3963 length:324 start_codon:yes stop_codon:yes gene_type:complete
MSDSESEEYLSDSEIENTEKEIIYKALGEVADVTYISDFDYQLDFYEPNQRLIEDESKYTFELEDGIPILYDAKYFIVFCNKLINLFPNLKGITLKTNLEGGGELTL